MMHEHIVSHGDKILVTGSSGFIGAKVVGTLAQKGFFNIGCFVRPSSDLTGLDRVRESYPAATLSIHEGNLLSPTDCSRITENVPLVIHLAAGKGTKSFPDAYMNSVVATRNLLEAISAHGHIKRFVHISSFTVYTNRKIKRGGLLDETCEIEPCPQERGDAYCYAKVRQDEFVVDYAKRHGIPYVIVRPGYVYGPGDKGFCGRIGFGTFGIFVHVGGSNILPLTYVDNCAEAIVLSGITPGVDGESFNVVDDELPTAREFLRLYKKRVGAFRSLYMPKSLAYVFCRLWEAYSRRSRGQLPPVFNRKRWSFDWKGNRYSNEKIKDLLGWRPKVPFRDAMNLYAAYRREMGVSK